MRNTVFPLIAEVLTSSNAPSSNMKKLFLDIETLPAGEEKREILELLYAKKQAKRSRKKYIEEEAEWAGNGNRYGNGSSNGSGTGGFDAFVRGTSFDGGFGRILCIGYAVDDRQTDVLCNPDDEKKMLEEFWNLAEECDLYIGHNIIEFDLRFIYQRSVVLGVRPTPKRELSFARYRSDPIFDTMKEWSKWGMKNIGLEEVSLALGIPSPKDGIDGGQVFDFYKAGKVQEICEYCKRDVETTREVYKRMVFEPKRPTPSD